MIKTHPVLGKQKSVDLCSAFVQGAPKNAIGHVFYGVNITNIDTWRKVLASGEDWFYLDNSFFDKVRGQQFRIAKNRIQTDPLNVESDGRRFEALGVEINPFKPRGPVGSPVIAVEQSPEFMSTIARDPTWLQRESWGYGEDLRVRSWTNDKLSAQQSFAKLMDSAALVITHSSAAAVTALCEGVHVVVSEMSAVHSMRVGFGEDHRRRIMNVLADNQFDINEIRNGKAWSWLARR